jgi:hypothetical protein
MLKRDKLESLLSKITDDQFGAIWKNTYGILPEGSREELVKDFVAGQYDGELDGCIALADSFLRHATKPESRSENPGEVPGQHRAQSGSRIGSKPKNKWLPPR